MTNKLLGTGKERLEQLKMKLSELAIEANTLAVDLSSDLPPPAKGQGSQSDSRAEAWKDLSWVEKCSDQLRKLVKARYDASLATRSEE